MNETFLKELSKKPVFCFTSDLDWASESMIEETLNIFIANKVPLTPFITHDSETIKKHYVGKSAKYVGLHPNYFANSTQGTNADDIISNLIKIHPEAKCFRSHSFYDHTLLANDLYKRGFEYDSNLLLHLQPNLVPLQHASGLIRFPVFLEDDIYILEKDERKANIISLFKTPGLKIFNFHPIHVCLNTPSIEYYESVKSDLKDNWQKCVYKGEGVRTLLLKILHYIADNPGLGVFYLDDLYAIYKGYEKYSLEQKCKYVRNIYDQRDGDAIYTTSRDFNLREVEIEFIINSIKEKDDKKPLKILDIGCGNGYTDVRIAETIKAEITGIDFSDEMVRGAKQLKEYFKKSIIGTLIFMKGKANELEWENNTFDVVITERCLLNLASKDMQYSVIHNIHRILKKDGLFIMVEGTANGLRKLNDLRIKVGLEPIPDRAEDNLSSLKFEEEEIEEYLSNNYEIIKKQHFGMYYLISRVIHPLLVLPDQPKYDAKINKIAKNLTMLEPDFKNIGHIVGYVLRAI